MAGNVHENLPTGVIRMTDIELRVGSGKIIAKYLVLCRDRPVSLPLDTPSLVVDLLPLQCPALRMGSEFLNVLRKVGNGIAAGLPSRYLEIDERRCFIGGNR